MLENEAQGGGVGGRYMDGMRYRFKFFPTADQQLLFCDLKF